MAAAVVAASSQPDDAGQLSQKQRDIIAATFKTARDSAATDKKTLDENLATLRLSQQRLREQAGQLANRLVERGIVDVGQQLEEDRRDSAEGRRRRWTRRRRS